MYTDQLRSARNLATNLIKNVCSDFTENLIQENSSDQGKLLEVSKRLLNPFPPPVSKSMLANGMYLIILKNDVHRWRSW